MTPIRLIIKFVHFIQITPDLQHIRATNFLLPQSFRCAGVTVRHHLAPTKPWKGPYLREHQFLSERPRRRNSVRTRFSGDVNLRRRRRSAGLAKAKEAAPRRKSQDKSAIACFCSILSSPPSRKTALRLVIDISQSIREISKLYALRCRYVNAVGDEANRGRSRQK